MLAEEEKAFQINVKDIKGNDERKRNDSRLGTPVDYAPVAEEDAVGIKKEELPMMSEREEKMKED